MSMALFTTYKQQERNKAAPQNFKYKLSMNVLEKLERIERWNNLLHLVLVVSLNSVLIKQNCAKQLKSFYCGTLSPIHNQSMLLINFHEVHILFS